VIYGDTDSIMINTNETDLGRAKEIGKQLKKEVRSQSERRLMLV
jgi:DNA polymerase elongation subunit (family B)